MKISWQPAQPAQPAPTQLGRKKKLRLGASWAGWASCQLNSQSDGRVPFFHWLRRRAVMLVVLVIMVKMVG